MRARSRTFKQKIVKKNGNCVKRWERNAQFEWMNETKNEIFAQLNSSLFFSTYIVEMGRREEQKNETKKKKNRIENENTRFWRENLMQCV